MIRSFVAPVTLAALAALLAVGACNRQGPTTSPKANTALLMESLGTASAIPSQQCGHELPAQPLIIASARVDDGAQIDPLPAIEPPMAIPELASGRNQYVACIPPFAQQDNAVPLTRVSVPVEF